MRVDETIDSMREKFLSLFVNLSKVHGVNYKTYELCAQDACISLGLLDTIFPGKVNEVIEYFFEKISAKVLKKIENKKNELEKLKYSQKVSKIIEFYFLEFEQEEEFLRALAKYYINPAKLHLAIKKFYTFADEIWVLCKDESVNFSYYTKRASLSIILANTLSFWLFGGHFGVSAESAKRFCEGQVNVCAKIGKAKNALKSAIKGCGWK